MNQSKNTKRTGARYKWEPEEPEEEGRSGVANSSLRLFLRPCINTFSARQLKVALCPLLGDEILITLKRAMSL